jgi:DNA-directed RNA polymerase subunit RPC12/RpoP
VRLDELPEGDLGSARIYGCDMDSAGDVRSVRSLECVECGREQAAGERGWKAYLPTDEDEPAEAVVYCPECASRKFEPGTR